jgi:uncharacterized membrane protein
MTRRFATTNDSRSVNGVVHSNIEALLKSRKRYEDDKTATDRLADLITKWSGSMTFVYLHVAFFGLWIAANVGIFKVSPFDPFPFGLLTTIVSLEAIFLSTFVLVSQNRDAAIAERREELDLQIDLLSEHEITRILQLVDAIAQHLNVKLDDVPGDLQELKSETSPAEILNELDRKHGKPG